MLAFFYLQAKCHRREPDNSLVTVWINIVLQLARHFYVSIVLIFFLCRLYVDDRHKYRIRSEE